MADADAIRSAADVLVGLSELDAKAAVRQADMRRAVSESADPDPLSSPLGDYLARSIRVEGILVEPRLVVRGGVTATIGRAGKGKTTLSMNRLLSWAAGRPLFLDLPECLVPVKPLKILVVENEGAASLFHEKLNTMFTNSGFSNPEAKRAQANFHVWGDGGYAGMKLDSEATCLQLEGEIDRIDPDIVFIEPFRSIWSGEENSATEMGNVVDKLAQIATDHDIAVMLAHHERKGGTAEDGERMSLARGSSVLEGFVAVMEHFSDVKAGAERELSWSKNRYGEIPLDVRMKYDRGREWYTYIPPAKGTDDIYEALNDYGPCTIKDLIAATGENERKVREALKKLGADGRVARQNVPGMGHVYRIPESNEGGVGF